MHGQTIRASPRPPRRADGEIATQSNPCPVSLSRRRHCSRSKREPTEQVRHISLSRFALAGDCEILESQSKKVIHLAVDGFDEKFVAWLRRLGTS